MTPQEMIDWYTSIEFKERGKLELDEKDICMLMIMYHNQEKGQEYAIQEAYNKLRTAFEELLTKYSPDNKICRNAWLKNAGL